MGVERDRQFAYQQVGKGGRKTIENRKNHDVLHAGNKEANRGTYRSVGDHAGGAGDDYLCSTGTRAANRRACTVAGRDTLPMDAA